MSNQNFLLCEENYTVVLTTEFQLEQFIIAKLLDELLKKNSHGIIKIAIFKYSKKKVDEIIKKIAGENKFINENLHRVSTYQPSQKNIQVIVDEAGISHKEDFLIIYGAERLCNFSDEKPQIERGYKNLQIKIYSPNQLDIEKGINRLFEIRKSIPNLVSLFETSPENARTVFEKYKNNKDIEVNILLPNIENSESVDVHQLLGQINKMNLTQALASIEEVQGRLTNEGVVLLKFGAYINNGYKEEALSVLKENYNDLDNSFKLMIANLLNSGEHFYESLQILKGIYADDKWLTGLPGALVTASKILDDYERESVINNILSMNTQEPYVLQECANFYNKVQQYNKSGKIFREIYNITESKFFELLARIAELQDNLPEKGHHAENYLKAIAVEDPSLENEVFYRSALMWRFMYNSMYMYCMNLAQIRLSHTYTHSFDVMEKRLEVLSNNEYIEKGLKLKPSSKERDYEKLISLRTNLIVDNLEYLFLDDKGHILLKNFIEDTQSKSVWEKSLAEKLKKEIKKWNEEDLKNLDESIDSYEESELAETNSLNAIRILRQSQKKITKLSKEEMNQIISGATILAEKEQNKLNELWIRYEAATWFSYLGHYQDANNQALTLLNYHNRIADNEQLRDYAFALGITAWGDSQFRLGREIEGLICSLVAVKKGLGLKNYYLIDKGLNIIYLWLTNKDMVSREDKALFNNFTNRISEVVDGNSVMYQIQTCIAEEKWEEAYELMRPLVLTNDSENEDANWATHFTNYISMCMKCGKSEEAIELLLDKALKVSELLENRLDIRWKAILMWTQILLSERDRQQSFNLLEILLLNKDLLKIAVEDVEEQRSNIFHREERAYISDQTSILYRNYVETLAILSKLQELPQGSKIDFEKEAILHLIKLSPRTIAEKKLYEGEIPDELEGKFNEYISIYDELMKIKADIDSVEYQHKTHKFSKLQKELTDSHPYLRPLPLIEIKDLSKVQESLLQNEIFYQYSLTPMGMVYLLITKEEREFGNIFFNSSQLKDAAENLGEIFSGSLDKENIQEVENLCNAISQPIFSPLFNQRYIENISNLFICPDMSVPYFSTSLIRSNQEWFIYSVDGIFNLISVSELLDRFTDKQKTVNDTNIISIGSKSWQKDRAIPTAEKWVQENPQYFEEVITDFGKENQLIIETLKKNKPKLFTLIAHGVEEPGLRGANGAFRILGPNKKYLTTDDIEDISLYTENMFFATCRSGQPYAENLQSSNSVWTNIVSQKSNTILCRWDVDIRPSLILLEHIMSDKEKAIPHLICEGQKHLMKSKDWNAPSAWAGYEYWGI
ncbi:hypothetical protein COE67_19840 [Priestia megaterium]|uniref:hypothetical protein n=1 Tax=Priestia megaterium TaxID=1404 RepID=UPI000BFB464E|nr:hypothetical protein [Priestia megaterium]PGX34581.1 hypothetical protein COE67_19840 [Priestia megaterium]